MSRTFSGGGGSYRPQGVNYDIMRQAIATDLAILGTKPFVLYYLEAANNSGGDISLTVYDQAGLVLIPTSVVADKGVLTYRSDFGTPMNGISWIASAPGLVGWFCGAIS